MSILPAVTPSVSEPYRLFRFGPDTIHAVDTPALALESAVTGARRAGIVLRLKLSAATRYLQYITGRFKYLHTDNIDAAWFGVWKDVSGTRTLMDAVELPLTFTGGVADGWGTVVWDLSSSPLAFTIDGTGDTHHYGVWFAENGNAAGGIEVSGATDAQAKMEALEFAEAGSAAYAAGDEVTMSDALLGPQLQVQWTSNRRKEAFVESYAGGASVDRVRPLPVCIDTTNPAVTSIFAPDVADFIRTSDGAEATFGIQTRSMDPSDLSAVTEIQGNCTASNIAWEGSTNDWRGYTSETFEIDSITSATKTVEVTMSNEADAEALVDLFQTQVLVSGTVYLATVTIAGSTSNDAANYTVNAASCTNSGAVASIVLNEALTDEDPSAGTISIAIDGRLGTHDFLAQLDFDNDKCDLFHMNRTIGTGPRSRAGKDQYFECEDTAWISHAAMNSSYGGTHVYDTDNRKAYDEGGILRITGATAWGEIVVGIDPWWMAGDSQTATKGSPQGDPDRLPQTAIRGAELIPAGMQNPPIVLVGGISGNRLLTSSPNHNQTCVRDRYCNKESGVGPSDDGTGSNGGPGWGDVCDLRTITCCLLGPGINDLMNTTVTTQAEADGFVAEALEAYAHIAKEARRNEQRVVFVGMPPAWSANIANTYMAYAIVKLNAGLLALGKSLGCVMVSPYMLCVDESTLGDAIPEGDTDILTAGDQLHYQYPHSAALIAMFGQVATLIESDAQYAPEAEVAYLTNDDERVAGGRYIDNDDEGVALL